MLCAALAAVSSALRPAVLPAAQWSRVALIGTGAASTPAPGAAPLRAVDDEAKTAYNPGEELQNTKTAKGFLAPAPSPRGRRRRREPAEYLANPRFEVLSAAITLLSCAAYAFNTLNDLPETVATALPHHSKRGRLHSSWRNIWPGSTRGASTRGADQRVTKKLSWPNGQGVALLRRRLRVRVPS